LELYKQQCLHYSRYQG